MQLNRIDLALLVRTPFIIEGGSPGYLSPPFNFVRTRIAIQKGEECIMKKQKNGGEINNGN